MIYKLITDAVLKKGYTLEKVSIGIGKNADYLAGGRRRKAWDVKCLQRLSDFLDVDLLFPYCMAQTHAGIAAVQAGLESKIEEKEMIVKRLESEMEGLKLQLKNALERQKELEIENRVLRETRGR
jgi:NADH:ubiquinone oxidoreductase subunit B-like Fe-S oxidoreductase